MSFTLEEFVENRNKMSPDEFNEINAFFKVFFEAYQDSLSLNKNPYTAEQTIEISLLRHHAKAISDFLHPLNPEDFYKKQTKEKWEKITNSAQQLNTLLNKESVVDMLDGKTPHYFRKGIQRLNELGGFGISYTDKQSRIEAEKEAQRKEQEIRKKQEEAQKEKQARKMFENDGWADISKNGTEVVHEYDKTETEEQKEQLKNRLRNMSPIELADYKKEHENKLKDVNKIKTSAKNLKQTAVEILGHYSDARKFGEKMDIWIDNHGKKYRESLDKLNDTIGKEIPIDEKDSKFQYIPADIIKAAQSAQRRGERHYEKSMRPFAQKYEYGSITEAMEFVDKVFDDMETFDKRLNKFTKLSKKVPKNQDLNQIIEKEENKLKLVDEIMKERNLSQEELDKTLSLRNIGESKKSLRDIFTNAKATNQKVRNGSEQFNTALTAIDRYVNGLEKYSQLKEKGASANELSEAAKNMQEKANEAREYINKYFKRKNKELWNNAKSKERMGYMSKALEEINKADKQITDEKKVTDSIVKAEYEKRQELIKAEEEKNAAREAEIAAQKQEILKAKQEEELKKQELEKAENAKKAAEAAEIENMKKTDPIGARIRQYKADSAEHMKARDKNPNLGTVAENAALVAAESIEELDKLSKNNALTPEQKKEAVTHIARVFAYDNEMFTQSKNVSKNEFKQTVRPLAESNFFQSSLGDITPDSLKSFCTTPKKSVELKGQLHANGGEERLRHEVAANKKKMLANDKTAKREALKKKNEEIDNLRLNAPSLKDKRHPRTRSNTITKKPKPMGG